MQKLHGLREEYRIKKYLMKVVFDEILFLKNYNLKSIIKFHHGCSNKTNLPDRADRRK